MVRVHKITCGATYTLVMQGRVAGDDGDDGDDGDGRVIDRCVGGA